MSIAGLDIGTTGCKVTLYSEAGALTASAYREYAVSRRAGEHELDGNTVREAVYSVLREIAPKASDLKGLGVTSFGESFVLLDERDRVLAPSMLYTDPRGVDESAEIAASLGRAAVRGISGVNPHPMYSLPKLAWIIKREPETWAAAKHVMLYEDFIVYSLCGESQIDYSLASRTMALDIREKKWSADILASVGVDEAKLPRPVETGTVAGEILPSLAAELGLPKGVVVVTGCHDQVAAAIGAGVFAVGMATDGSGTVECVTPVLGDVPELPALYDAGYAVVPYLGGSYVCYAFSFTGGALLKWFRDGFTDSPQKSFYADMDKRLRPNPTGLLVLPHFAGAATPYMDPGSKGAVIGLTLEHDRYDLYRALMESVAYEMRLNCEKLAEAGVAVRALRATGGGSSSEAWIQMKSDILDRPIISLDCPEAGTVGCIMLTGVATGVYGDLESAHKALVRERKTFEPRAEYTKRYNEIYSRYKKVYGAVRPLV